VVNRATYTRSDGTTGQVASVDFEADGASVTTTEITGAVIVRAEGAETATSYVVTDNTGQTMNASTFTLADGTHPDAFYPMRGDDSVLVDVTDTRFYWLGGGTGSLTLRGGAGDDVLFINAATLQANIDGGDGFDLAKVNDTQGVTHCVI
jgi:Ca2+-binding RTX toxin-like protein